MCAPKSINQDIKPIEQIKIMNILITGNMGYVGPVVSARLRESHPGARLTGVDIGYFAHCLTAPPVFPECRIDTQHFMDVRDITAEMLEGVDAIVHLAAISNDPMGNMFEEVTVKINLDATIDLANKAKKAGVKSFVFASSCSVYGFAEGGPRGETSPLNPLTAYARSKVFSEQALEKIADGDFVVTCLRFATACGMSDRLRLDLVLNDFVASALATNKISILSDGTPWRPLINVQDMARAIDWAVQRKPGTGDAFLVVNAGSNDWNYRVKELAEAVAELIPGVEISVNKDAMPDKRSYKVSFDRFKELAPDHQPQVDLYATVSGLRDGLLAMNFSDGNFRDSHYMRLKVLTDFQRKGMLDDQLRWCRP
jgi:nucleoside-diphosphate-sugar epimerase